MVSFQLTPVFGVSTVMSTSAEPSAATVFSHVTLEAVSETLTHNLRSQSVLDRLGFVQYGRAAGYMHIAGAWQDHLLYQLLTPTPHDVPTG